MLGYHVILHNGDTCRDFHDKEIFQSQDLTGGRGGGQVELLNSRDFETTLNTVTKSNTIVSITPSFL